MISSSPMAPVPAYSTSNRQVRPVANAGQPFGAKSAVPTTGVARTESQGLFAQLAALLQRVLLFFRSLFAGRSNPVPPSQPGPAPVPSPVGSASAQDAHASSRKVFIHYMPWFETTPNLAHWKWGAHDPTKLTANGLPDTATVHHPLIGPYDSRDEAVIGYQLLLMKAAGFDGMVDLWYGSGSHDDQATKAVFDKVQAWTRQYGFDFSVSVMVEGGPYQNLTDSQQVATIDADLNRILDTYARSPVYQKLDGKPVVYFFPKQSPNPVTDEEWRIIRSGIKAPFDLITEDPNPAHSAVSDGSYGWVKPGASPQDDGSSYLKWLYPQMNAVDGPSKLSVGVVYPGFDDSGVNAWSQDPSKHRQMDRTIGGQSTMQQSWDELNAYNQAHPQTPINWVQTTTWNDWNEGTELEPSVELGDQALETAASNNYAFKGQAPVDPIAFQFAGAYLKARRAGYTDQQLASALKDFFKGDYTTAVNLLPH